MCKYCKDTITLNELTTEYSGIEITMSPKGWLRVRSYSEDGKITQSDAMDISNCLMCGRKLGGN